MLIEIFGYIGSALVVVSMLMSSVVKLRIINTVGSIVSGIYAVICGAFPLALMNACLIIINVYNLFKLLKTKQEYALVDSESEDACVRYFLECYNDDIKKFFPGFARERVSGEKAYVVYCNDTPSGVLLGKERDNGIDITIEYSTPAYRDCSVGRYLYSKLPSRGVNVLRFAQKESQEHIEYMKKMGFIKEQNGYVKCLEETAENVKSHVR